MNQSAMSDQKGSSAAGARLAAVVAIEIDQRQKYLFETDRLKEMLGASRIMARTVEVAERLFDEKAELHLHAPVSGAIHAWAPVARKAALLHAAWQLRLWLDDRGVSHTCVYAEVAEGCFVGEGAREDQSLESAIKEVATRLDRRKGARGGEDARPACALFATCEIHGHEPFDEKDDCERPWAAGDARRERAGYRARRKLDEWMSHRDELFNDALLEPFEERFREMGVSPPAAMRPQTFVDLADAEGGVEGAERKDSYIAFVCGDGDGMGQLLKKIEWNSRSWDDRRAPWARNRDFAREYANCIETAFRKAVAQVVIPDAGTAARLKSRWEREGKRIPLPLLPQLLGGDDLWMVVDRKYALSFCLKFGTAYEEAAREGKTLRKAAELFDEGNPLTLSFGVAFAKAGFPANAMTDVAHGLLSSAKSLRKGLLGWRKDGEQKVGHVDWHWVQSSRVETAAEARAHLAYCDTDGKTAHLTSRPWTLVQAEQFRAAGEALHTSIPRRKLEQLEEILRLGHTLSCLAWEGWWKGLPSPERGGLEGALKKLPEEWRPAAGQGTAAGDPWLPVGEGSGAGLATPLLDLLSLADVFSWTEKDRRRE